MPSRARKYALIAFALVLFVSLAGCGRGRTASIPTDTPVVATKTPKPTFTPASVAAPATLVPTITQPAVVESTTSEPTVAEPTEEPATPEPPPPRSSTRRADRPVKLTKRVLPQHLDQRLPTVRHGDSHRGIG